MRAKISYILCVVLSLSSMLEVVILPKNHVQNLPPGVCWWASVQTVGKHFGYVQTEGLADYYAVHNWKIGSNAYDVDSQLALLNVPHEIMMYGSASGLKKNTDAGIPVLVSMKEGSYLGAHIVVVYDVTPTHVYFIDTNYPGDYWRYDKGTFTASWTGVGMVILPKENK